MRTLGVFITSVLIIVAAVAPADAQVTPPRQNEGGSVPTRPRTGTQQPAPAPPATTPPATTPPVTTPPATSPPATSPSTSSAPGTSSPPVASPPVSCPSGSVKHSNGAGQSYCNNTALGVPGNAATYSFMLAASAANAWPAVGPVNQMTCPAPGGMAAAKQTAKACGVWGYSGSVAGRVTVNTSNNACYCPRAADPPWN